MEVTKSKAHHTSGSARQPSKTQAYLADLGPLVPPRTSCPTLSGRGVRIETLPRSRLDWSYYSADILDGASSQQVRNLRTRSREKIQGQQELGYYS